MRNALAECVEVSLLVVLPLRMLWRVRLSKRHRRMILSAFASSVVLAFAALFHILGRTLNISVLTIAGVNVEVGPFSRSLTCVILTPL